MLWHGVWQQRLFSRGASFREKDPTLRLYKTQRINTYEFYNLPTRVDAHENHKQFHRWWIQESSQAEVMIKIGKLE